MSICSVLSNQQTDVTANRDSPLRIQVNTRGRGASTGSLEDLPSHDLAQDLARVIVFYGVAPAHLSWHAFGGRIARCLASDRRDLVCSSSLLPYEGRIPLRFYKYGFIHVSSTIPKLISKTLLVERLCKGFIKPIVECCLKGEVGLLLRTDITLAKQNYPSKSSNIPLKRDALRPVRS